MALKTEKIFLDIAGFRLLEDVSASVMPGKVTAVLGPNGAGKTSLLRVISGELTPQLGSVFIGGQSLQELPAQSRARRLAVLPQHSALSFPFTVEEVVRLGRIPHDTGVKRDVEIIHEALLAVDAEHLAKREYTRLSGGEKQRVHFARVLTQIWEAQVEGDRFLVLDEPTSSLDLAHQQLTVELVRDLAAQGVGVLIAIHDINLAALMADHMVLLKQGAVVAEGPPKDILTVELVRSVFEVDVIIGLHPEKGTPTVLV
jgi:iron complex transport system ATP-binding protein